MSNSQGPLTAEQKEYLAGLAYGADVARAIARLPVLSNSSSNAYSVQLGAGNGSASVVATETVSGPDSLARSAQDKFISAGKTLSKEEQAKRAKNGLDVWDDIAQRSQDGVFPNGTDVFLTKFHGLFYVAPAEQAFMCRMRIAGGSMRSWQLRGVAEVATELAGGFIDVTTRANLQLRQIAAKNASELLLRLRELDITCQGSGADNIRNCTCSPLSGIDASELIETLPYAKRMHHYILANRDMYGLPRKFNIAFDGGGRIASLQDTNDIGFRAVQVTESLATNELPEGVYFQLTLGGITGHHDFARSTGVIVRPAESVAVAAAIVRVFARTGDRTDRKRARLKYVLDDFGFDSFLALVDEELGRKLTRVDSQQYVLPQNEDRYAHVGIHAQRQAGLNYVGVVLPVGRLTSSQAATIADIAEQYGNGEIRLTVWQNLIIPNVASNNLAAVTQRLVEIGLDVDASSFRAGLVACTGNAGCKYAGANTKLHALQLAGHLESLYELDSPINIHLTGCHHSCAQHYIGDIGMQACSVEVGDDSVEGYHIYVGGGWGEHQSIARLLFSSVAYEDCQTLIAHLIGGYLASRRPGETFTQFAVRLGEDELRNLAVAGATNSLSVGS